MGDGVTKVGADGGVYFGGTLVPIRHEFLNLEQLLGERHISRQLNAGGGHEARHGLLREVLSAHAGVP